MKGGGACNINIVRAVTLQRQSTRASRQCHTSHTCYFYPWLLIVVSSEPHRRPLWRILSSLTSACLCLLRNQRFSQMSSWDKWEPFAAVMAPRNDINCFSFCPFPVHFFILSYRIFKSLPLFLFLLSIFYICFWVSTNSWILFDIDSGNHQQASVFCQHCHALQHFILKFSQYPPKVGLFTRININAQNILNTKMTKKYSRY